MVGVAVAEGGKGVSLVNMAQTPHRAVAVQDAVAGGASAADAAAAAPEGAAPPTDNNGDAAYRNPLAQVFTERALTAAMG